MKLGPGASGEDADSVALGHDEARDTRQSGHADLDTPPYVPTRDVARYPDDPRHAIDGGADGLDVVRTCLAVIAAHASPGAPVALQVRGPAQVDHVTAVVGREGLPLTAERAHVVSPERAVLVLRVAAPLGGG